MALTAYSGLTISDGGATTLALTTTLGKVVSWSGTLGGVSAAFESDPAVQADKTNNRLLLKGPKGPKNSIPGQPDPFVDYLILFDLSIVGSSTVQDIIAQLFINGVKRADASCRGGSASTYRTTLTFSYLLRLLIADNPGTIVDFAEPGSTPYPRYVGAGGAPETMVPAEIYLATVASTLTVTLEAGHFSALKLN